MHPDAFGFDRIRVSLEVHDEHDEPIEKISLELSDDGYPESTLSIKDKEPQFDGQKLREKHFKTIGSDEPIQIPERTP